MASFPVAYDPTRRIINVHWRNQISVTISFGVNPTYTTFGNGVAPQVDTTNYHSGYLSNGVVDFSVTGQSFFSFSGGFPSDGVTTVGQDILGGDGIPELGIGLGIFNVNQYEVTYTPGNEIPSLPGFTDNLSFGVKVWSRTMSGSFVNSNITPGDTLFRLIDSTYVTIFSNTYDLTGATITDPSNGRVYHVAGVFAHSGRGFNFINVAAQ